MLTGAGVPLDRALSSSESLAKGPLRSCLAAGRVDLRAGKSLADALDGAGGVIPRVALGVLRAGERAGRLVPALEQVAVQLRAGSRSGRQHPAVDGLSRVAGDDGSGVDAGHRRCRGPPLRRAARRSGPGPASRHPAAARRLRFRRPLLERDPRRGLPGPMAGADLGADAGGPAESARMAPPLARARSHAPRPRHRASYQRAGRCARGRDAHAAGARRLRRRHRGRRGDAAAGRGAGAGDERREPEPRPESRERPDSRRTPVDRSRRAERAARPDGGPCSDLSGRDAERRLRALASLLEPALVVALGGMVAFTALALLQALYGIRPGGM